MKRAEWVLRAYSRGGRIVYTFASAAGRPIVSTIYQDHQTRVLEARKTGDAK